MIKGRDLFIVLFIGFFVLTGCTQNKPDKRQATSDERQIEYYTCGMHPSVKVLPEEYNEDTLCPICNMKLIPVYKEGVQEETRATSNEQRAAYYGCGFEHEADCPHCDFGKTDAECICGHHSFVIEGRKIDCPVCGKGLRELTQEEADRLKGIVSRVKIKDKQAQLAGVRTEPLRKLHLYKEIRTVGRVAYDPELVIAQEEFVSALKTLDRVSQGDISEIKERSMNLVRSSKRRLKLLGLSDEQISELQEEREIESSLILPEDQMWIYGEVYEHEMAWVKAGEKIKVSTSSFPGEEFNGIISSVNPVLDPKTRSLRFRARVENPGLKLKPEMYMDIVIMSMYMGPDGSHKVLAIPKNAVLDTGIRKIVWISKGGGEYEGRVVRVGPEAVAEAQGVDRFYPVLGGLAEGEEVVVKANFLIDSQSQISGVAASAYGGAVGTEEKKTPAAHQH